MRLAEFRRGNRRIATRRGSVLLFFLKVEVNKFRAHGLDLLGHFRAYVEGIGDRAEGRGRANRGQTGHTGTDNQNLCRGHLARSGDLAGKEAAKVVARLDDRTITGDVGHRRQRVHLLRAADARHHVHCDHGRALVGGLLHQRLVGSRIEEGDQRLTGLQPFDFGFGGRAHLGDDIRRLEQRGTGLDDLHTGFFIGSIGKPGLGSGPSFDDTFMAQLLKLERTLGRHGHAGLAFEYLFRCSDLHPSIPLIAEIGGFLVQLANRSTTLRKKISQAGVAKGQQTVALYLHPPTHLAFITGKIRPKFAPHPVFFGNDKAPLDHPDKDRQQR